MNKTQKNIKPNRKLIARPNALIALALGLAFILILRLSYLQYFQYSKYATLSLKNQMDVIPIAPTRGIILDRNGIVLAKNIPIYTLEISLEHVKNLSKTLEDLQKIIPSITKNDVDNFYKIKKNTRPDLPIPLKLKLSKSEVAIFASNQYKFQGVAIKAQLMRYYPFKELTAHSVGYVARINTNELKKLDMDNYHGTDFIGKTGIERYYEPLLHGKVGHQQIETDANGKIVRVLNKVPPKSGKKLYLTLDIDLQKIAMTALADNNGAIVLLNPQNGEILALVSNPSYDPNIFVKGINQKTYQSLLYDTSKPLYNRAVQGNYPPASTIKPFMAIVGLENNAVTESTSIYDPGWYQLPKVSHIYHDWRRTGHGAVNIKRAITVSCDTYFYQLGHKLGINKIYKTLSLFGFGQNTGIDLYEESKGLLPNPEWKKKATGLAWYPGDTLISAIGQGSNLASPLQLANAVAIMSLHGERIVPHLLINYKITKLPSIKLQNPEYWDLVIEGMRNVIKSNEGTAYRFGRNAPYEVAGKTGTAQVFGGKQYEARRLSIMPKKLRDHSWFIAFAPIDKPKAAIAVLVENDVTAASIARQVLDAYFNKYSDSD